MTRAGSTLVVLAARPPTVELLSVTNGTPPAMLPYKGRPLIYQTIVEHLRNDGNNVIVTLPTGDTRLVELLTTAFGTRLNLVLVATEAEQNMSIASLRAAISAAKSHGLADRPAYAVYDDLYLEPGESPEGEHAVAFVGDFVDSDRYSYFSGPPGRHRHIAARSRRPAAESALFTDIGGYWFPSLADLDVGRLANGKALSVGGALVSRYGGAVKLSTAKLWRDLGSIGTATGSERHFVASRAFNTFAVDETRGVITKTSTRRDKIMQEVNYYRKLPAEFSIYYPRLYEVSETELDASYATEYYGYRTLSEYFVFRSLPALMWEGVAEKLLAIHGEMAGLRGPPATPADVEAFYLGKLRARMDELPAGSAIRALVAAERVTLNGKPIAGWRSLEPHIVATVRAMAHHAPTGIIHGDLCFSNILFDPRAGLLRLVDPRGAFYTDGCYGDPRYDLAKLLHSFHGGYDFVIHEMYHLTREAPDQYQLELFRSKSAIDVSRRLLSLLERKVGAIKDLIVLEGLLFLSMLPLHVDDEARQTALYLLGIGLLNDVYGPPDPSRAAAP